MAHADAALIPAGVDKAAFWQHVYEQLASLLDGQRNWITNLANASSLIYSSLLAFPEFGHGDRAVNWCGFYLDSALFPAPKIVPMENWAPSKPHRLLLGPFCGKPACQEINIAPGRTRGVCAGAFIQQKTLLVPDVEAYPGHIACDGETKSEIVVPLVLKHAESTTVLGVLDLDCLALSGFDERDRAGLERIAQLVVNACDW